MLLVGAQIVGAQIAGAQNVMYKIDVTLKRAHLNLHLILNTTTKR